MKVSIVSVMTVLVVGAKAAHNCTGQISSYYGFGCDLFNLTAQNENLEIELMTNNSEANKTDSDIKWVQIRNSRLGDLPKGVFEKFVNMAKVFIKESTGLKVLDVPLFSANVDTALIQKTDLEVIGENAFSGLVLLKTLDLMRNQISKIHKNAFQELVNLEYLALSSNNIEFLDDDVFANNSKLETFFIGSNKLTSISARLFSRNPNIANLDFNSNAITQIEKGFLGDMSKVKKLYLIYNECITDSITLTTRTRFTAFQSKLKDCYANYALMKSSKIEMRAMRSEIEDLKTNVNNAVERVDNDLKILEGKFSNSTALEEIKNDLVNFFKSDEEVIRKNFVKSLYNASDQNRMNLKQEIEKEVSVRVAQNLEAKQEKLIQDDVESVRRELSNKISFIYFLFFAVLCAGCVAAFFHVRKSKVTPTMLYQNDDARLLASDFS